MRSMLCVSARRIGTGYWSWLRVALVVVVVAHRRLGPSSVGHDLHDGSDAAGLGGPGALLEPGPRPLGASAHDESHLIRTA